MGPLLVYLDLHVAQICRDLKKMPHSEPISLKNNLDFFYLLNVIVFTSCLGFSFNMLNKLVCYLFLILYVPVNNFPVMSGRAFLG